jgi:hypothetical protein
MAAISVNALEGLVVALEGFIASSYASSLCVDYAEKSIAPIESRIKKAFVLEPVM